MVLAAGVHELIDGPLDVDLGAIDDDELHALVVSVHHAIARMSVAHHRLLAEWVARGIFERDGSRSAAHRLARETRSSISSCRTRIARANAARSLVPTCEAVVAARLSTDHLDLFASVNTPARAELFARDQQMLVDRCADLSYADAVRVVKYWAAAADDELAPAHPNTDPPPQISRLHASRTIDDTLVLDATFSPIDATILERELHRLTEQLRLTDQHTGTTRTPSQRRAAALIEMATRSASTPADARRPQPLFTVLIGATTFDKLCELSNGIVVRPGALAEHLTTAMIESVLFDGPSTIIAVSHQRTFTGALRRAIQVRDRRCTHRAGCDTPAELADIDHIIPHSHGGPTSQFNGRVRCIPQNRLPWLDDHDRTPLPERPIDRLDELRNRIRWRHTHYHPHDTDR